jgi:hypothetical protein
MIICLLHIQLTQYTWLLGLKLVVQTLIRNENRVYDLSSFHKGILGLRNDLIHNSPHSIRQNLGNDLINLTHKTNRAKVLNLLSPMRLRNKRDKCRINTFHKFTSRMKILKYRHKVSLNKELTNSMIFDKIA